MQCGLFDGQENTADADSHYGRTYQEPSHQTKEEILLSWLEKWQGANWAFRPEDGRIPELLSERTGSSNGVCWTHSGSEFHKDAEGSLLSQILESGEIDPRYFLSEKACRGILNRAERREKILPPMLKGALLQGCGDSEIT